MSDYETDNLVVLGHLFKEILKNSNDIHNGVYVDLKDDGRLVLDGSVRLYAVQEHVVKLYLPKE